MAAQENIVAHLKAMESFSGADREAFLRIWQETKISDPADVLFQRAREKIGPENQQTAFNAIRALMTVAAVLSDNDKSRESEVLEDLFDQIQDLSEAPLESSFKDFLKSILGRDNRALRNWGKATALRVADETLFQGARVVTDLRPIFDDSGSLDEPEAALMVHNLILRYNIQDGADEFHIAMTDQGLQNLIDVLQRAQEKAKTLRGMKRWGTLH